MFLLIEYQAIKPVVCFVFLSKAVERSLQRPKVGYRTNVLFKLGLFSCIIYLDITILDLCCRRIAEQIEGVGLSVFAT